MVRFSHFGLSLVNKQRSYILIWLLGAVVSLSSALLSPPAANGEDTEEAVPTKLSLAECYARAEQRSEQLLLSALQIKQAEARYRLALSSVFPKIAVDSAYRMRDNDDFGRITGATASTDDPSTSTGGGGGSLGSTQFEAGLSLTQPLFHGFRDILIAEAEEAESSASRLDKNRRRDELYLDVATLYHQVLLANSDLAIYKRAESTLQERITELRRLRDLGRARDGEVAAAQSELAKIEANRAQTIGTERTTKELLAFLVGLDADSFSLESAPAGNPILTLEQYLSKASEREDVRASKIRAEAQDKRLEAARRASWPTFDAVGTAYGYEDPDRNREWEAAIQLSIPIFDGGKIASETAQEAIKAQSLQVSLTEQKRLIERDVKLAYQKLEASRAEVESLKKHLAAAKKNYEFQKKDYELGVVNNLDVLQGIRSFQDAALQIARAESQTKINQIELEVAAGGVAP